MYFLQCEWRGPRRLPVSPCSITHTLMDLSAPWWNVHRSLPFCFSTHPRTFGPPVFVLAFLSPRSPVPCIRGYALRCLPMSSGRFLHVCDLPISFFLTLAARLGSRAFHSCVPNGMFPAPNKHHTHLSVPPLLSPPTTCSHPSTFCSHRPRCRVWRCGACCPHGKGPSPRGVVHQCPLHGGVGTFTQQQRLIPDLIHPLRSIIKVRPVVRLQQHLTAST